MGFLIKLIENQIYSIFIKIDKFLYYLHTTDVTIHTYLVMTQWRPDDGQIIKNNEYYKYNIFS